MLNEDFFSYAFVSELNTTHVLVTMFQSQIKQEREMKRKDLEAAQQNYKTAEAELAIAQNIPSATEEALEFDK